MAKGAPAGAPSAKSRDRSSTALNTLPSPDDATHTGTLPCVVYAAKSTEDVRGSIDTQLADCRAAIEREGGREVVGEDRDEGVSGFKRSRGPGLERAKRLAVQAAERHGTAELWVQHSDRIARGDG